MARITPDASHLVTLVEHIDTVLDRVALLDPPSVAAGRRIRQLSDHLGSHVRPRARSLEAPLLVMLLGPTGAGKSSLFNALVGRAASRTGVLRPTTRELVALVRPEDRDSLTGPGGPLAGLGADQLRLLVDETAPEGVILVDAPDVDSVEHANRELTDRLVEAADLAVFVTTATRYADRVPWEVLGRVRERGLPLTAVVNRMPPGDEARTIILEDLRRLFEEGGLGGDDQPLELVPVAEGSLDPATEGLAADAIQPLRDRIDALAADRDSRLTLAARALGGALAGLEPQLRTIADDLEHGAIDADRLRRLATDAYERELGGLRDDLSRGTFLRAEALRQWQEFVGADELTRMFATGIGRVRGALSSFIRGRQEAPVAEVRDQTLDDLVALARVRLAEAARRTATAWAEEPAASRALESHPEAWTVSDDVEGRLGERLRAWVDTIAEDVRTTGGGKRTLARGASVGVNAAGIGVMLATFSHTGGLTGAEVGIAAATGFLNQKLLSALFGEAAMVEMIQRARQRLVDLLGDTFRDEVARFDALTSDPAVLRGLAEELRALADELRRLPGTITVSARAVVLPDLPSLERQAAAPASATPSGSAGPGR
ncbi:MAG: 50S ribosome-binding GTPase [Chloroflexi bacterium]|nr:50S ribosome-binding GTPase [Chloroflexota bacterium]